MSEVNRPIRGAVFGGFNRQDVTDYITRTARESQERLRALEEERDRLAGIAGEAEALRERNRELEERLAAAGDEESRLRLAERERDHMAPRMRELEAQAEEYRELKQHIAGIELDAHKRGDQVVGDAERRAEQIIREAEAYAASIRTKAGEELAELSARYQELLNTFEVVSSHVTGELRKMDVAVGQLPLAFNRLSAALRELKGEEK